MPPDVEDGLKLMRLCLIRRNEKTRLGSKKNGDKDREDARNV